MASKDKTEVLHQQAAETTKNLGKKGTFCRKIPEEERASHTIKGKAGEPGSDPRMLGEGWGLLEPGGREDINRIKSTPLLE